MIAGLKPYPAYKDSGVEWLAQVPEHWEMMPIGRMGQLFKGNGGNKGDEVPAGVPCVRYGDLYTRHEFFIRSTKAYVSEERAADYTSIRYGDILFAASGETIEDIGRSSVNLIETDACCGGDMLVLRPKMDAVSEFLGYASDSATSRHQKACMGRGFTVVHIYGSQLKILALPISPLPEQAAIVRFLDYVDRRIRRYIRAKKKLIKLLEEQKQAIIHQAVTGQINVRTGKPYGTYKPSGVEWLGDVPEHWEVRRAKAVCSAVVDCKNRTPDEFDSGEYTVVRTTCIRDGQFDETGGYKTDEKNYRVWTARGAPRSGDVFFTREAPAGEACLVPDRSDLCMGQRMMYLRPDPNVLDAKFLLLNVYGPLTSTYLELATNGSTVGHLRLGQVDALPIMWCPLDEQREIVAIVDEATREIDETVADARMEISLIEEYRTRLIADVVTGKLDVREAAASLPDEPEESDATEDLDEFLSADYQADDGDDHHDSEEHDDDQ